MYIFELHRMFCQGADALEGSITKKQGYFKSDLNVLSYKICTNEYSIEFFSNVFWTFFTSVSCFEVPLLKVP